MAPRKSIRSVAPLSEELREVLSDHEAGQERLLTLAQVEGDTDSETLQSDPPHREHGHEDCGQVLSSIF